MPVEAPAALALGCPNIEEPAPPVPDVPDCPNIEEPPVFPNLNKAKQQNNEQKRKRKYAHPNDMLVIQWICRFQRYVARPASVKGTVLEGYMMVDRLDGRCNS